MKNDYEKLILDAYFNLVSVLSAVRAAPLSGVAETDRLAIQEQYKRKGYLVVSLPQEAESLLLRFFSTGARTGFRVDDYAPQYYSAKLGSDVAFELNENHVYWQPSRDGLACVIRVMEALRAVIEAAIGPFEIQNIRGWTTLRSSAQFGPTELHSDGLADQVRKIMLYPICPTTENGTFEVIGRDGIRELLNSPTGPTAVLADVGYLAHRGVPPTKADSRPAIEVTITPSLKTRLNGVFAGHNARVRRIGLSDLECLGLEVESLTAAAQDALLAASFSAEKVNIGGGRKFSHKDWANYDVASQSAVTMLSFTPFFRLPQGDGSARLTYSSHALEHLADETVQQVFSEVRRISSPDAAFVVKIPDFERVLAEYRNENSGGILDPSHWNISSLFPLWRRHGVEVCLESIAAMIFCGYWSEDYGNEFMLRGGSDNAAYHGPPKLGRKRLRDILLSSKSPHFVAATLRAEVKRSEFDRIFNHQNAWSRSEFESLAMLHGFSPVPLDSTFESLIPSYLEMQDISAYFSFSLAE